MVTCSASPSPWLRDTPPQHCKLLFCGMNGKSAHHQFPGPKICQKAQNGLSQKWCQIGRSYLYGRDTATFRFWGLKRNVSRAGRAGCELTPNSSFRAQKFVKKLKMAYLKNGVRSAVAIYMAEIRPLLGFGGWNVMFLGQGGQDVSWPQTSVSGPKNLSKSSKYLISKMVSDRP